MTGTGEQFARSGSWATAVQRVNEQVAFLQQHPGRLREMQQAVANLTGELTSPDGLVTVQVDSAGQLTDVRVAPDVYARTRPEQLARTVLDLARQAGQDVLARRVELTRSAGQAITGWSGPTGSAATPARPGPVGGRHVGAAEPARPANHRAGPSDEDDMPGSWLVETDL
ncbi:MAG TPA: YbaB/EbfC family nucleoid-associated protein [Pseudonocardiaceae bacterium]|jgi:DNA-binding protein YbaB|nr:YbaB/EbfC family nucleoid-associated protein [Pseudonocardiaceae bacterium]